MHIGAYRRVRVRFTSKLGKAAAWWKGGKWIITSLMTLIALLTFLPGICPFKHSVTARLFCNKEPWICWERKHCSNMHIFWVLTNENFWTLVNDIAQEKKINYYSMLVSTVFSPQSDNTPCLVHLTAVGNKKALDSGLTCNLATPAARTQAMSHSVPSSRMACPADPHEYFSH